MTGSTTSLLDAPNAAVPLQGDQQPRIRCVPLSVASSGPEVRELAARAGLVLDPWEADVLDAALGERANGDWAAFEVGLIVPRQNGKGSILEARELGGLFLLNEPLLLHTAHEVKTAGEAFLRILGLITDSDEFSSRVKRVNKSHGEEGIELKAIPTIIHGAGRQRMRRSVSPRLRFLARSRVSGRGFTGRVVFLDEAFELTEASMAALLPTMSAQPNPQLWYTSTPPDQAKDQNAWVLARLRSRGMAGTDPRLVYLEWSAAERAHLSPPELAALRSDQRAWARANPGLGIRITEEFIASELGALEARSFEVERLGIGDWPSEAGGWQVIGERAWAELHDPTSTVEDPVAIAADVSWDRAWASIGIAGRRADGMFHSEVIEHRQRTDWVVARLAELAARWQPLAVVIRSRGPAGFLIPELEAAGVEVVNLSSGEGAQACGLLYQSVTDAKNLRHLGQPELASALSGAARKPVGDAWTWARKDGGLSVDLTPLYAVTDALWGYATRAHLPGPGLPAIY